MGIIRTIHHLLPRAHFAFSQKTENAPLPNISPLSLAHLGVQTAYTLHNLGTIVTVLCLLHAEYQHKLSIEENQTLQASYELLQKTIHGSLASLYAPQEPQTFFIHEALAETLPLFSFTPPTSTTRFQSSCPPNLTLLGSSVAFQHIVANLLVNALQAVEKIPQGCVSLSVRPKHHFIELEVRNTRSLQTHRSHIRRNYGLGLHYIRHAIEKEFQGQCRISQTPTSFSVTVSFPKYSPGTS